MALVAWRLWLPYNSMLTSDQLAVYVPHVAPTVLPPLGVRNCENPLFARMVPLLALHKMRIEAVPRLDLAKDDVILLHNNNPFVHCMDQGLNTI